MNKEDNTSGMHSSAPGKSQNRKRLLLFKVITISFPFLLLALTEGILRISGYGENLQLFQTYAGDPDFMVMNQSISLRYFAREENATIGFSDLFLKEKTPGTFRVFILGGSTGIGDPYIQLVSFGRWLQYRLMHTFPETNFEIINLCLTAVNSYTIYDFAGEVVKQEPDAILIYSGHNEYYGALGVGSTSKLGNQVQLVRMMMKLRRLRVIQLISNGFNALFTGQKSDQAQQNPGLMQKLAAGNEIPYLSKRYEKGIKQFETNMDDACRIFAKADVPVFISNLVCNEKDMEPFASDSADANQSAADQFDLAEKAYADGDFGLAKELYVKAKDLDILRFRAPEKMNDVIDNLVAQYSNVFLVDTKSLFEDHSPHGIIGKELILDHLHPNIFGYGLISEAFYRAMKQQGTIVPEQGHEMSFAQLIRNMPVNRLDSLRGIYATEHLMQSWPFHVELIDDITPENSVEGELAYAVALGQNNWFTAVYELSRHYIQNRNWNEAFRLGEAGVLETPYDVNSYLATWRVGIEAEDLVGAAFYLGKAYQLEPDQGKAASMLDLLVETDQPELALPYLDYLINNANKGANYIPSRTYVNEIIDLKADYALDSSNIGMLNQIAGDYIKLGNREVALKYVNQALRLDPDNQTSLELFDRVRSSQ